MGDNCLDDARLSKFCGVISAQITEAFERDKKRLGILFFFFLFELLLLLFLHLKEQLLSRNKTR